MITSDKIINNMRYIKVWFWTHLLFKDRFSFLLDTLKNKNIIHIWPCNSPFTREQYESNDLLYQKLDWIVNKQVWVDIDLESINYLNSKDFSKSKIYHKNMNDSIDLKDFDMIPDFVLMWEVIEHLMNLETSLKSIHTIMTNETKLIITTPNASRFDSFISNFLNISTEHEDHKVWFQLVNLVNLLETNWYEINDYYVSWFNIWCISSNNFMAVWVRKILSFVNLCLVRFFPLFWSTHIIICSKVNN